MRCLVKIMRVVLFCLLLLGYSVYGGNIAKVWALNIAFIDLERTFEDYNKTKEAYKRLDKKLREKEKQRKKMVEEIRRLKDELELLSEKGKEEKQVLIDEKISQLGEFDRKTKDEFRRERLKAIREISQEIEAVIQQYGKTHGYDFIVSSRSLAFGRDELDITDEILKILNK